MARNPAGQEFDGQSIDCWPFSPFVHLLFQPALLWEAQDARSCSHSSCNLTLSSSCTSILLLFIFLYLIIHFIPYPSSPLSFSYLFPPLLSLCSIPCLSSNLCIHLSSFAAVTWIPSGWHIRSFLLALLFISFQFDPGHSKGEKKNLA